MFITADQLIAHAFGDYVLQSDWMANEKTKKSLAALAHVATYFLPFLFLTHSWKALVVIISTHFFIDRFRLARFVCWVKNFMSPPYSLGSSSYTSSHKAGFRKVGDVIDAETPSIVTDVYRTVNSFDDETVLHREYLRWWVPWNKCHVTGYPNRKPLWMTVWLMIITDNLMHVLLNALALRYL